MRSERTFPAKLEQLPAMLGWIRGRLADVSIPPRERKKIELACEEVLMNIIGHAYGGALGTIEVCAMVSDDERMEIEFQDEGPPFNPLGKPLEVDLEAPLESREEGGLGIYFIRNLVDDVRYRREGKKNVLTLAFTRFFQTK